MDSNSKLETKVKDQDEDEEEADTLAPLCTCGQFHNHNIIDDVSSSSAVFSSNKPLNTKTPTWLESSFVHLLSPRKLPQSSLSSSAKNFPAHAHAHAHPRHNNHQQHGFLESYHHLLQLLDAATSPASNVSLCADCIDRVAAALEADTERLYIEAQSYQDATTNSKQRSKTFQNLSPTMDQEQTELAYRNEIDILRQEVDARESELTHLHSLYQHQLVITQQLDEIDDQVQQEQNSLELQSKAFDNSIQLKTMVLSKVQMEVDRLMLVKLPHVLFDLQVDQRGLRYPLINQLRLAYRPKGDIPLKEIQVAWSQATQLLLILGTLLQFRSSDWKLVPLADCSKLIYRKDIYNLSPGDCRSLMAWNALLDQVVKHAVLVCSIDSQKEKQQPPPFSSSSTSIGNTDLTQIDRKDPTWSHVIHRMASNLLWLSECTSDRVAIQVGAITHCIA
jgi:hypothetical protein